MTRIVTLAGVLALAAGCHRDRPAPTVPASALPDTTTERELTRSPTATPTTSEEDAAMNPEATAEEDEVIPTPPAEVLAGGGGVALKKETVFVDPGADDPAAVTEVVAVMMPTKGSKVRGTIKFRQAQDGLELTADISGLPKGNHAFHVHVFGDCSSPDGESAGPHFNFAGKSIDTEEQMITGDLGELVGSKAGKVKATTTISQATLQGKFSIVGRSIIIHEKGNDATHPPDGAAGKRLACGVIGVGQVATETKAETETDTKTETATPPPEAPTTPEKTPAPPPTAPVQPTKPK